MALWLLWEKSHLLSYFKFYAEQKRLMKLYAEDEANLCGALGDAERQICQADLTEARRRRIDRILTSLVFVLNICVLAGNITAAILSGSYSVMSILIESSMDLFSSVVVFCTIWAINHTNSFNYPRGRERLEIVSVVICSVIMDPDANLPTILIITSEILVKSVIGLICYRHGSPNSRILALDQQNDCITSAVAIGGAWIGDNYWLLADPICAILVCSFVAVSWFSNAFKNIPLIVGRRVEQERISRILRIATTHDDRIKCLDHLMVYHLGEKALVEMHVVLDEHLPLKVTHDLTEALQRKIAALDFVERVFLHVDYRCDGHFDGR